MKLRSEFIAGNKKKNVWSGVYGYKPESSEESESLGEIYAAIKITTPVEDFELDNFVKIIMNHFQESYFNNEELFRGTLDRIESSLWKMKSRMDMLLSKEDKIAEQGIDFEMSIVLAKDKYLYIIIIGESKVYISRNDEFTDVSKEIESVTSNFFRSASLEIEEDDHILIATSDVESTKIDLKEMLKSLDVVRLKNLNDGKVSAMMIASSNEDWSEEPNADSPKPIAESKKPTAENQQPTADNMDPEVGTKEMSEEEFYDLVSPTGASSRPNQSNLESIDEGKFNLSEDKEEADSVSDDTQQPTAESKREDAGDDQLFKDKIQERLSNVGSSIGQFMDRFKKSEKIEKNPAIKEDIYDDFEDEPTESYTKRKESLGKLANFFIGIRQKIQDHFKDNQTTYVHILRTIKNRIIAVFKSIYDIFKSQVIGGQTDRRFLTENKRRVQRNRIIFVIAVVVLSVFLFTTVSNALGNSRVNSALDDYEAEISSIETDLEELQQSIQVGGGANDVSAKQNYKVEIDRLYSEASALVAPPEVDSDNERLVALRSRIDVIEESLDSQYNALFSIELFDELPVIVDLSNEFQDAIATDLEYDEGSLFISDGGRNVIYKTGTQLDSALEVHITGLTNPQVMAKNYANEIVVMDQNQDSMIGVFNVFDNDSFQRYPGLPPSEVGVVKDFAIYEINQAMYELHTDFKLVYKRDEIGNEYLGGGAEFVEGDFANWRIDDAFSNALDVEVTGEIFVLSSTAGLTRHLSGGENTLAFENFSNFLREDYESLKLATAMDVTTRYIAIGDSVNNRIMIFQTDGNFGGSVSYLKQYQHSGDSLSDIKEIQINEADGQIYVLDGNRVLRFSL